MVDQVIYSRKSDNWATPIPFYHYLIDNYTGPFFDPCPMGYLPGGSIPDGLDIQWGHKNFVNPPYSKLKLWAKKAYDELKQGRYTLFLCPARTDTKAFHLYLWHSQEIVFIEGRLKFNEAGSAPFPSMLCIFDPARIGRYCPEISRITKDELAAYMGQQTLEGDQNVAIV